MIYDDMQDRRKMKKKTRKNKNKNKKKKIKIDHCVKKCRLGISLTVDTDMRTNTKLRVAVNKVKTIIRGNSRICV